jgi:hypothetical protein
LDAVLLSAGIGLARDSGQCQGCQEHPGAQDVSDASWLAQLGAHGLLRASFVPPEPIRELRDLTRARAITVQDRTREIHRLEKFLEGSGIKLTGVVSNLTSVSSRAMLEALVSGERDPEVPAQYARQRMRSKIPELAEALTGRFGEHQACMVRLHLDQIDHHTSAVTAFTDRIEMVIGPFRARVILTATWNLLTNGEIYTDPGADYYLRRDPEQARSRAVRQLKTLGFEVSLTPASA